MITLQYGPVYTSVLCDDEEMLQEAFLLLCRELTFEVPGYIFSPAYMNGWWDGRKSFFDTAKKQFLSGLLSKVLKILSDAKLPLEVTDYPVPDLSHQDLPTIQLHPDITLRDTQMHAVKQALKYGRGVWKLATNAGKTEAAAGLLKVLGMPPSLFIVPRQEIFFQTVTRFQERLQTRVGAMGGGKWDPNFDGVNVAMFQTLRRHLGKTAFSKWLRLVKIKLGDECHFMSDAGYERVWVNIPSPMGIGMSGTPFKENIIEEYKVRGLCGPVIATVGNKELIEQGVSVKPKVVFLEPNVSSLERKMRWENAHWETALHNCPQRTELIANLAHGFVQTGRQTIIMVARTGHGELIHKLLPGSHFTHAGASNRRRVKDMLAAGEPICCIATSIFDTGLSVDYLECLINAAGGNAKHTLLQRLGRLLRRAKNREKDVWFIDFWDTFNKTTRSHSRDRWEIMKAEGAFDMQESSECLPADVFTQVWEGAGVATGVVRKSGKRKWQG